MIVSAVFGSALTGGLIMVFGVTLRAPHGGIWVLPLMGGFLWFLVALAAGVALTTTIVLFLKSLDRKNVAADAVATA
ncbi:hypothetical protein GCM10025876_34410 [Demequina litorisediminis]|uniref:Uncharacterized protein n=1 Tax=Demequina litorisediminis TaxID=1849022 RepID=A0ABQ6IKM5_9MICO|nr:hypothetical protein GCM10025876_34410 [Demequina litorisediminis]